jgi:hypothetical protein
MERSGHGLIEGNIPPFAWTDWTMKTPVRIADLQAKV